MQLLNMYSTKAYYTQCQFSFIFLCFRFFTELTLVVKWWENPKTRKFVLKNMQCVTGLCVWNLYWYEFQTPDKSKPNLLLGFQTFCAVSEIWTLFVAWMSVNQTHKSLDFRHPDFRHSLYCWSIQIFCTFAIM